MKARAAKHRGTWIPRAAWLAAALAAVSAGAQETSICAEVRIEIRQELTLERQAFDAMMRINNGVEHVDVENVLVNVRFADDEGNLVTASSDPNDTNALFFIIIDSLQNIGDVDGSGVVAGGTSAEMHWLIIPAPGAGGATTVGTRYYVGAELSYTLDGKAHTVDVEPDYIFVKPLPELTLDYFLPGDVYADDAFTTPIEPPVPFPLGVRIVNAGYGPATELEIDTGQPVITDNEQGLLVSFRFVSSEVNGVPAPASLLADFGDIGPGSAGVALWFMETSLSGEFTDFQAEFSHADELGGKLTSLIKEVNTHRLLQAVQVDLPGRDGVRDFLARDGVALNLYESEGVDAAVADVSGASSLSLAGQNGLRTTYQISVPATTGPLHVSKAFVASDTMQVISATRSDGKRLPVHNAWLAKHRETGTDPWDYTLNLFDVDGGGTYTVIVEDLAAFPLPPVLQYIGDRGVRIGDPLGLGFLVEASDPNGTVPALTSTLLPSGTTFQLATNDLVVQGTFFWLPGPAQGGIYPVRFTAADDTAQDEELVKLYVGQPGDPLDGNGLPTTLAGQSVVITNLVASSTATQARVEWAATPGFSYDVLVSDGPMDASVAWSRVVSGHVASADGEQFTDASFSPVETQRFYQVVLAGEAPFSNGVWGVVRRDLPAGDHSFVAPPLRGDRALTGEFGDRLGQGLQGHDGGPGDELGAEAYLLLPDGRWRLVYLDAAGVWREEDGSASTAALTEGEGMILRREGAGSVRATFVGEVGNDGSRQVDVREGWNLLALSEGRRLPLDTAFSVATAGGPAGAPFEDDADQIILWDEAGAGRWLMYGTGGQWIDTATLLPVSLKLRAGQVIYYYRQPGHGTMNVTF